MPADGIQHHEPFGFPSVGSCAAEVREIISGSPIVASLLPHLMRTMADEIERESYARSSSVAPLTADPYQPLAPVELRSLAQQVAYGLSVTLCHHLVRSLGADACGIPGTPGESVLAAYHLLRQGSALERPHHSGDKPSTEGRLQLKLLGSPEITLDGVRLKALERCTRASLIIYILALHPRGLSSERLAACITQDSGYTDALDPNANMGLGAVRTFIWRLRKLAGWPGVVVSPEEQGGYQSRYRLPDDTACDLWDFEAKLDEAARLAVRANMEPDTAHRAAALRQDAVLLYRGEFCKGIGAGAISDAAEYLRQRYLQAVLLQASYWKDKAKALQQARQESGFVGGASVQEETAWLEALSNYGLAAQAEPYDEAAYAGVMLCQAHLGQRKGIQKTLARCSQVLNTELDRNPHSSTIRTAQNCLRIALQVNSIPQAT
jgi:DNA-binding SARP family transcriptional activator